MKLLDLCRLYDKSSDDEHRDSFTEVLSWDNR